MFIGWQSLFNESWSQCALHSAITHMITVLGVGVGGVSHVLYTISIYMRLDYCYNCKHMTHVYCDDGNLWNNCWWEQKLWAQEVLTSGNDDQSAVRKWWPVSSSRACHGWDACDQLGGGAGCAQPLSLHPAVHTGGLAHQVRGEQPEEGRRPNTIQLQSLSSTLF